jgi:hypothetical protein
VILGLLLLLRSFRSRPADEELTPEEAKRLDRLSDDRPE